MTDSYLVLDDCERYWRTAGISRRRAGEMRAELAAHLAEAAAHGKGAEAVIGPDVAGFARSWAEAQQGDRTRLPPWNGSRKGTRYGYVALAVTAIIAIAIVAAYGDGGSESMDDEVWRWIWLGTALFLGFAEMVTAGFFMLPFAAGAVIAFVLALFGVAPAVQLVVFIVSSVLALVVLQRYVRREDEIAPRVGANRLLDQRAVVLEPIDRVSGTGRVRMDTELWRATTEGGSIPVGTEVRVVDVRGARLVVEAVEED